MSLNISNSAYLNSLNRPAIKVIGSSRTDSIENSPRIKPTAKTQTNIIDSGVEKTLETDSFQKESKFELSPSQSERIVHLYRANNETEEVSNAAISQYLNTENIAQQDSLKSSLVGLDIYV